MDGHGRFRRVTPGLALILAFAWGCGGGDGTGDVEGTAGSAAASDGYSASLTEVNESGMAGSLRVESGGDSATIKLEVLGVDSSVEYDVPLRRGGCEAEGEQIADVGSPTVATVGLGSSLVRVPLSALPSEGRVSVRVHLPDGTLAACGEVPTPRGEGVGEGGM